jgi:RND family efflux transporter MFP subunit
LPAEPRNWLRGLLILPPLVVGIAIVVLAVLSREPPEQAALAERVTAVRAIQVPEVTVVPRATGFGLARPEKEWRAVAQVGGKVIELHPNLKRGEILPAGSVLLRLDPVDYQLKLAEIGASIRSAEAELRELAVRAENFARSRDIERRVLDLAGRELERRRTLLERGNIAAASVDEQEKTALTSRQRVQDIENALNLIPAQRQVLEAKLALYHAQLADARLDLERTTITAPFDLRVTAVNVELGQFAGVGGVMVEADGIAATEVEAQLPIEKMARLIPADLELGGLTIEQISEVPKRFGLSALIRLESGAFAAEWEARVARIGSTVDPQTRTVGVIVAVDQPYKKAIPGRRPPLLRGMYVRVELRGRPRPGRLVVPRAALHVGADGGPVAYVVDADQRLERRRIGLELEQADFAAVTDGLAAGDWIVLSDVIPAIDGMRLQVIPDPAAADRLRAAATGARAAP